ncbi:MAG: hypothetical protein JWO38_238 [Gemmataceae bacterium]|nr:hypothetical protein [Gemmataceae bacterium]
MELLTAQLALFAAAVWMWVWLIVVLGRDLPATIYVQQNLGVGTPPPLYRLVRARRWLVVGGMVVIGAACLIPEARTASLLGMFVVSAGLLTYVHIRSAKLLHPRVVKSVLAQLHGDTPHDRFADKLLMRLYEERPEEPPPAAT